ncbi:kinase-like domain-containing protein [Bisporella sp. PMI_857]|nr:kinase-like domain-containing protein [Bisporella sp. PMI_857]
MSNGEKSQYPADNGAFGSGRFEDEFPDDMSCLSHAPATSHGTYLAGNQDGLEDLEDYQIGGYHPIHLGDCLGAAGRYQVIHKLGYGGFSTVWLCHDIQESHYVAVKVHTANIGLSDIPDLRLQNLDKSAPGAEFINIPKDHFSHKGPNGTHQCLAFSLLGPRVSPSLWMKMEDPGSVLRKMCLQTAQALRFLHHNRLCHGDFRPANILVKLANLESLNEEKFLSLLEQPKLSDVLTESGEEPNISTPKYLVASTDLSCLGAEYLTEQICVIDFGESFSFSSPSTHLGIPENYLPPEYLMEDRTSIGPACDLWALGCTLFEIRRQMALFYMLSGKDDLLAEMVDFFGKLPEPWWIEWEARTEFFEEDGKRIIVEGSEGELNTLRNALNHKIEAFQRGGKDKKVLAMPEDEQNLCEDLLMKLFSYKPGNRLSAEEVVQHDWFKM